MFFNESRDEYFVRLLLEIVSRILVVLRTANIDS